MYLFFNSLPLFTSFKSPGSLLWKRTSRYCLTSLTVWICKNVFSFLSFSSHRLSLGHCIFTLIYPPIHPSTHPSICPIFMHSLNPMRTMVVPRAVPSSFGNNPIFLWGKCLRSFSIHVVQMGLIPAAGSKGGYVTQAWSVPE